MPRTQKQGLMVVYTPVSPLEYPQTDGEDGHQLLPFDPTRQPSRDGSPASCSSSETGEAGSTDAKEEEALFDDIIARVRSRYQQRNEPDYARPTYILEGQEAFDRLLARLEEHCLLEFFQTSLRWNWNSGTGQLELLLMTEAIHEVFKDGLTCLLKDELGRIAEDHPALQNIVEKIGSDGHTRVGIAREGWQRCPDGQFKYSGYLDPPFVYDIGHAETEDSLSQSVNEHLIFRAEAIGGMLTISIAYNKQQDPDFKYTAWLSLYGTSVIEHGLVRNRLVNKLAFYDGKAMPGRVEIPFKLFVPLRERHVLPESEEILIRIEFADLARQLERGIEQQRLEDAVKVAPTPPGILLDEKDQKMEL
ncbi:hypothetical protein B0I35DRAFT_441203 [Stachybotrys elegans]|uniref:Uncharacterized protein n=1 Tax=Stachybotrys elegans TaxID=80388 RepID=A0A8K0SDH6_9HYPO|nr:hypothetical protein B0I35DRAFT_441203 [Stachybotrys elegans]